MSGCTAPEPNKAHGHKTQKKERKKERKKASYYLKLTVAQWADDNEYQLKQSAWDT